LELVESGRLALAAGPIIPLRDKNPEEEPVLKPEEFEEECPHGFSLDLIQQFLDGELEVSEEEVLKQQINSCSCCQEEASELAELLGRGDELSLKMGLD
jgi:hypothetical protein